MNRGETFLAALLVATSIGAAWLYDHDTAKLKQERDALRRERDALRAQVAVLRAVDGDGSCAVQANGPRVLCALLGDRLQRTVLSDGEIICALKDRWSGRATCRLADGREITLRRTR